MQEGKISSLCHAKMQTKQESSHDIGVSASIPLTIDDRDLHGADYGSCKAAKSPRTYDSDTVPMATGVHLVQSESNVSNESPTRLQSGDLTNCNGQERECALLGSTASQQARTSSETKGISGEEACNDQAPVPRGSRFSNTSLLIQNAGKSVRRSSMFVAELGQQLSRASVVDPTLLGPNQCSAIVVNYISAGYILLPFGKYNSCPSNPGHETRSSDRELIIHTSL